MHCQSISPRSEDIWHCLQTGEPRRFTQHLILQSTLVQTPSLIGCCITCLQGSYEGAIAIDHDPRAIPVVLSKESTEKHQNYSFTLSCWTTSKRPSIQQYLGSSDTDISLHSVSDRVLEWKVIVLCSFLDMDRVCAGSTGSHVPNYGRFPSVSQPVQRPSTCHRQRDSKLQAFASAVAPEAVSLVCFATTLVACVSSWAELGPLCYALQEPLVASTSGQHNRRELGEGIRSEFPILHQKVHGDKQLIYFDNGATSQKPKQVLEALRVYNEGYNANVHRGVHYLAAKVCGKCSMSKQRTSKIGIGATVTDCYKQQTYCRSSERGMRLQATTAYEDAREKVAQLINARSSREIVFTSNGSAALNLVAHSWGRNNLGPGDEVRHEVQIQRCNTVAGGLLFCSVPKN